MKIRLATIIPDPTDGCSMARGMMPLSILSRVERAKSVTNFAAWKVEGSELELVTHAAWSWAELCGCDVVFLQRPYTAEHLALARLVKQLGLPLWIDYDDALMDLPASNPHFSPALLAQMRDIIPKCVRLADAVTVTTEGLRQNLAVRALGDGCESKLHVIPNAHNDYLLPFADLAKLPRQKVITWRGTATHDEDLLTILPQLVQVAREFADWKFVFLGGVPWQLRGATEGMKNIIIEDEWCGYFEFMNKWCAWRPFAHIVPLADSEFNRCKSNLAWLEASAVGAVTLAPEGMEFRCNGIVRYSNAADFGGQIAELLREFTTTYPEIALRLSRNEIQENLLLSQVNELRRDLLVKLHQSKNMKSKI